jgi:hypothetical protein
MHKRQQQEQQLVTVGHAIAAFLEACEVKAAFGVISIHNMPILDAMGERGKIRFVMARGEAGGANMADAYARTTGGLGVCLTSTGTAAGNAAGAMVEALTAGTPLLHITGQIETPYLDQSLAYIHEAPDQLTMLKAVSKAAFRVRSADTAISTMKLAVQTALTAPAGPVSVEIPIDIQAALIPMPDDLRPLQVPQHVPSAHALDELAERLSRARRPMLWLGGGARHAAKQVKRLMDLGFGVVTSTQGRGIVPEACSSWFLPRIVGISKAMEWCATGRVFDAQEALAGGLVSRVVKPEELQGAAQALAREIAENTAPVSIALTRQMLWRMLGADHPMEAHKIDSRAIYARGRQGDAREGVVSFLEKRPANFPDQVSKDMPVFYPWWNERKYS